MRVRPDVIRIYKSVHTWTGIVAGMALFIAFYAGALTVFKEPLTRWASPPRAETTLVPLADAQSLLVQALRADPQAARDFTIHLHNTEQVGARMGWQLRPVGADEHDEASARHYMATLTDHGMAQIHAVQPSPLADFIDVLHRVVGLPVDNDPNRWIMGVIAVLYTLALVSGVIVLLPSLVKDFFALRVSPNLKRMWLDAHNVVGIISLPFHLVMALTAVAFAYHDGFYALQNPLLHEGRMATAFQRPTPTGTPTARDPAAMLLPSELVARVQAIAPSFEPSMLQYQQVTGARAMVRVWGKDAGAISPRARGGFAAIDPYSGNIISTDLLPGHQDAANLTISSIFALHMASFGGALVQWLYFLLGLAGAWLFYSGNLLWVETRRKAAPRLEGSHPVQRRDTRLMAAATIGVCLGCVCGISLTIVGSKWLHLLPKGLMPSLHTGHQMLYYLAFLGCLGWAFIRGAARASAQLLWLAAVLTLTIPLTTLLAWSAPTLGLWAHTSPATLGVDATATVMALGLTLMARAAHHRAFDGRTDSVWSARTPPTQPPQNPT